MSFEVVSGIALVVVIVLVLGVYAWVEATPLEVQSPPIPPFPTIPPIDWKAEQDALRAEQKARRKQMLEDLDPLIQQRMREILAVEYAPPISEYRVQAMILEAWQSTPECVKRTELEPMVASYCRKSLDRGGELHARILDVVHDITTRAAPEVDVAKLKAAAEQGSARLKQAAQKRRGRG